MCHDIMPGAACTNLTNPGQTDISKRNLDRAKSNVVSLQMFGRMSMIGQIAVRISKKQMVARMLKMQKR